MSAERGALHLVNTFTVQPGSRVLWCLRRRKSDVRCVICAGTIPVEVQVLQDRDIVLRELFQEEWMAVSWAHVYAGRLKEQGWHDVPE